MILAAFVLAITTTTQSSVLPAVNEILIHTELGSGRSLRRHDYDYKLAGSDWNDGHGHLLHAPQVAALVEAIDRPVEAQPSLKSLDITPEALPNRKRILSCRPSLDDALARYYANTAHAMSVFPVVTVDIRFNTGRRVQLSADNGIYLMLPWQVDKAGISYESYDGRLGRAVGNLLAKNDVNAAWFSSGAGDSHPWWEDVAAAACPKKAASP